jgi:hypothetical protein
MKRLASGFLRLSSFGFSLLARVRQGVSPRRAAVS